MTYDISNATGALTNQPAVILSRHYDTNLGQFTTNTFQAFDLDLTVGANQITLHAKDMAGNVSTSNYTYTLDYSSKTNPPVVQLYWPTNGAVIGGTNFTWRGWVEDPTVTVSAQIVDSNGDINEVDGIVERNGNFWVEDLPLASGTNWLTLTATDATGTNVSTNNISVVQSLVNMAFTYVPDITNQTTVQVGGTVDSGYTVWVNGVQATNFGYGAWLAYNVPVNGAGTAVFEAMAVASSVSLTGGGGGTNSTLQNTGNPTPNAVCPVMECAQDKKPAIICTSYAQTYDVLWTDAGLHTNDNFITEQWALATPGYTLSHHWINYDVDNGQGQGNSSFIAGYQFWDAFGNGSTISYVSVQDNDYSHATTNWFTSRDGAVDMTGRSFTPEESCYQASTPGWTSLDFIYPDYHPSPAVYTVSRNVSSAQELRPGGKAASYRQSVLGLGVTATMMTQLGNPSPTAVPAPYNQISVMNQPLGNDDNLFVVVRDGTSVAMPVQVAGSSSFVYAVGQPPADYTPQILFNGRNVANKNVTVIVGEQINLTCLPSGGRAISNFSWTVGGTVETLFDGNNGFSTLEGLTETTSSNISFFWVYSGTYKVTCTSLMAGKTNATTTSFKVVTPTGTIKTFTGPIAVDSNYVDGFSLHFGDFLPQPGQGGILFSNFIQMPHFRRYNSGNTNYDIEWVQLVNSYSALFQTNDGSSAWYQSWPPVTNPVLDTVYPAPYDPAWHETCDAPSASLVNATNAPYRAVQYSGAFTMYLLFQPTNGNFVPLANVGWNWSGSAALNQVATNGNYWSLTGSNHSPNSIVRFNTTGYPQWSDNVTAHKPLTNTP